MAGTLSNDGGSGEPHNGASIVAHNVSCEVDGASGVAGIPLTVMGAFMFYNVNISDFPCVIWTPASVRCLVDTHHPDHH